MDSLKKNIKNILAGYPGKITYTDRPKEKASVDQGGLYANSHAFFAGHTVQDRNKMNRYQVSISLYQHKISLIGDCNGNEDEYFNRLMERIHKFESILSDVYLLLTNQNLISQFNSQIQAAYVAAGEADQAVINSHKIQRHDCQDQPKFFAYRSPFQTDLFRVGADLNAASEADLVDFVTIQFEIWKIYGDQTITNISGEFSPINKS